MKVFFGFFLHKKSTILSPPNPYKLYTLNSTLSTLHFIWAFRQSRRAFRYIFARFLFSPHSKNLYPNPIPRFLYPNPLAKDAAPIPNALR